MQPAILFIPTDYLCRNDCIYGNQRLQENEPDNASGDKAENINSIKRQTEVTGVERQDKCWTKTGMGCNT